MHNKGKHQPSILLQHPQMLSDRLHPYAISQWHGWWQAEDLQEGCHLPRYQHCCMQLSRHGDLPQGHSTAGQDGCGIHVTLPSQREPGEPPFSSLIHGKGFLLRESLIKRELPLVTWEIILHSVRLPSHICRKRGIKQAQGGNLGHPQRKWHHHHHHHLTQHGLHPEHTVTRAVVVLLEEMTLTVPPYCYQAPAEGSTPDLCIWTIFLRSTHRKCWHGGEAVATSGSCSRIPLQAAGFASLVSRTVVSHLLTRFLTPVSSPWRWFPNLQRATMEMVLRPCRTKGQAAVTCHENKW